MGDLYRALSVFWMPSATMSGATDRPIVIVPVMIPTVFAAVTSLVVYFKFPPADALLRGVWTLTLAVAVLGPAFVVLLVSGLFFLIFSFLGRRHGYRSFLSVTALAFVPSAIYHLAQSVVLMISSGVEPPSVQVGRLSAARLLDPGSVSSELFVAASMIDAITIWVLALLVVGYQFLSRESSPRLGGVVVIGGWIVYAAIRIAVADAVSF